LTKILIIRFSSIGDLVLTTPVIRCLKKQYNGPLELHYITKKSYRGLLESNPYIDKCFTIEKSIAEVIPLLKEEKYDYLIDLHNNLRSTILKSKLKTRMFTFQKFNIKKWMLVNFKVNLMADTHVVDRYMKTVSGLGVVNDNKGLDYFIPPVDEVTLDVDTNGYVAFAIGAKFQGKRLPIDKMISICKQIKKTIVLLGGVDDQVAGEEVAVACGKHVINKCGEYNLNQSASVLLKANLVLAHDTGLMHIASAFKKKIMSFWIATVPELGMSPYLPDPSSKIMQAKGLRRRPSSKLGKKYAYSDKRDAYLIPNEEVVEWVEDNF